MNKQTSPFSPGLVSGFLGVVVFSASLPATKLALSGFDPHFLTFARASLAGLLSLVIVLALRQSLPHMSQLMSLAIVSACGIIGFPFLTAQALNYISSAQSLVFTALLPLTTAIFGVILGESHPKPAFWIFSVLGSVCVAGFALFKGGFGVMTGNLYMLVAVIICGYGYAEGARLSRKMGGWQVISWALALTLPLSLSLAFMCAPHNWSHIPLKAYGGLFYVGFFSMWIGFFLWYRGLSKGGIASIGQLQLLQPFMGLSISALVLHEVISPIMVVVSLAVVGCVAGARHFSKSS